MKTIVKVDASEELHRAQMHLCNDVNLLVRFGYQIAQYGYVAIATLWYIRQLEQTYGTTIRHEAMPNELMEYVDRTLRQIPFSFLQQTILPPGTIAVTDFCFEQGTLVLSIELE